MQLDWRLSMSMVISVQRPTPLHLLTMTPLASHSLSSIDHETKKYIPLEIGDLIKKLQSVYKFEHA